MTVLLNKWDGQRFEHNHVRCDFCRRHGTVKKLVAGDCIVNICKKCLLSWVAEIDRAVLKAASAAKVTGEDACKECDGSGRINAWLHDGVEIIGCPTCKGTGINPLAKEGQICLG